MAKIDPRDKLTDFMTTDEREHDDMRTRILSKEQLAFYYAYLNLGAEEGLEFFREEAERDMRLCMSIAKLGPNRSEQIVDMFKHLDETADRDIGLQPITDYNRSKRRQP